MLSLSLTPPTLSLPCDALASDLAEKGEAERMGTHPILCTCAHVPSFPSLRSGPAPLSCWTPCPLLPRIPSFLHPPNSFLSCQSLLFFSFVLIRRVNIFFPLQYQRKIKKIKSLSGPCFPPRPSDLLPRMTANSQENRLSSPFTHSRPHSSTQSQKLPGSRESWTSRCELSGQYCSLRLILCSLETQKPTSSLVLSLPLSLLCCFLCSPPWILQHLWMWSLFLPALTTWEHSASAWLEVHLYADDPPTYTSIFNAALGLQTRMYIYLLETSAWMPTISKTCHVHDWAPHRPSLTSPTPNLPPAGQICNLAITHYFSPQAQKGYVTWLNSENQWVRNDVLYKK